MLSMSHLVCSTPSLLPMHCLTHTLSLFIAVTINPNVPMRVRSVAMTRLSTTTVAIVVVRVHMQRWVLLFMFPTSDGGDQRVGGGQAPRAWQLDVVQPDGQGAG